MDQTYWIIEYVKLLLAYGFVMFVWPSVVFRPYLQGKGLRYRFAFCTTVTVMIVTTCVLMMGLLHILHPWTTAILFFGVFAVQLFRNYDWDMSWIRNLRRVSAGTMSGKQLISRVIRWIGRRARQGGGLIAEWSRGRRVEFALLALIIIFGTIYFSYGAFDTHAYGCGDQYVHHEWIYQLKQGVPFFDGIYPEGFHCMIYLTCTCFGIRLYTGVLFFGCVHMILLLLAFYLFMCEIFNWRYSGMLALCLFLTLKVTNLDAIFGMARLSWALPLEYAMHAQFFSACALLRFYRKVLKGYRLQLSIKHPIKNIRLIFGDPDLLIFSVSIALTIAVHFYVTILAFFLCLSVAIVFIRHVFRRGSFGPVFVSVMLSIGMAVAPMAVGFASGIPFQGSIDWAIEIITGKDQEEDEIVPEMVEIEYSSVSENPEASEESASEGSSSSSDNANQGGGGIGSVIEKAGSLIATLYNSGLLLFPTHRIAILIAFIFALLAGGLVKMYFHFKGRRKKEEEAETKKEEEEEETQKKGLWAFDGILAVAISVFFFAVICAAGDLHLPMLLEPVRVCSTMNLLIMMLYIFPLDLALFFLARVASAVIMKAVLAALVLIIYTFVQISGEFHGFLFYHFTRYDAEVNITNRIIKNIPEKMFTIVSTTEELYQTIEFGYHEELLSFILQNSEPTYTLPTPYVFVYIEKHPLHYAHYHFATGPKWLARESYAELFGTIASQCPDELHGEISREEASRDIKFGAKLSDAASDFEGRTILESKLFYNWYEKFSRLYPNESRVVYEDDDFLCYCLVQNPASLYTLGEVEKVS